MSIYSGLPTRKEENNYNKLLLKLILLLQDHVLDLTKGKISTYYINQYSKILSKMQTIQQHKYLPPKFSEFLSPIMESNMKLSPKTQGPEINSRLESVREEEEQMNQRFLGIEQPKQKVKKRKLPFAKNNLMERISIDSFSMKEQKRSNSVFSDQKASDNLNWKKTIYELQMKQNENKGHKSLYRHKRRAINFGEGRDNHQSVKPEKHYENRRIKTEDNPRK